MIWTCTVSLTHFYPNCYNVITITAPLTPNLPSRCGQNGDQAARRIPLRLGAARVSHARHRGHDAGGYQAEQGQDYTPASE